MTGFLQLKMAGGKTSQITLHQAECYVKSIPDKYVSYNDLPVKGKRADSTGGLLAGNDDIYFVCGNGTEEKPECYEHNLNEQGIVTKVGDLNKPQNNWSFIDWTTEWNDTNGVPAATLQGPITMESLLYLLGLQYTISLCEYMEYNDQKTKYSSDMEKLRRAIRNNLLRRSISR